MIAIINVTKRGDTICSALNQNILCDIYSKSNIADFNLEYITNECFKKYKKIIFISSTGIAVRAISKFLKSKDTDPAIVVVDVCNNFTISLVSGHLGGANELTLEVSKILNNTPVITTATDNLNIVAPDIIAKQNNLIIGDLNTCKVIASKLVNSEVVYLKDDFNMLTEFNAYTKTNNILSNSVWITNKLTFNNYNDNYFKQQNILKLIRKNIVLGVGCRKDTCKDKMKDFVINTLHKYNIDIRAIKFIGSIDIKCNEEAILNLKDVLNAELKFFNKDELNIFASKYKGSDFVEKTVGVRAVSEPVIDLFNANMLVSKDKLDGMTISIGELK